MPLSLSMSALSMAQHPSPSLELDVDTAAVAHHHQSYHSSSSGTRHAFSQQQPRLPFSSPPFNVDLPSAFDDPLLFSPLTSPTAFRAFGESDSGYAGCGGGYPDIVVQETELDTASSHSTSPVSPSPSLHSMSYAAPSKSPVSAASSSSSSASSYSPSPPSSPRKRQRVSTKDRGAIRAAASALDIKVKHREIDAQRRQREAAMIQRLDTLTADRLQEDEDEEKEAAGSRLAGRKRRKEKVQILQDTVSRLEQLQEVVKELSAQCRQQEAVIQYMTPQHKAATTLLPRLTFYDDAPAAASSSSSDLSTALARLDADSVSHVLSHPSMVTALFVSGSCSSMLLDTATGNLVDGNAQFFAMIGWDRRDVIGCLITAPFDVITNWSTTPDANGLVASSWKHRYGRGSERPLVQQTVVNAAGQQEQRLERLKPLDQYAKSMRLLRELYLGQRESLRAVFRCRHADGRIYERDTMAWVAKSDWVEEPDGRRWRKPLQLMFQCGADQGVAVDDY